MEKLINFYKKLSPPARFRLIFFILASLIVVPVRITKVEVYEPYQYSIDDVGDNQVVFGYLVRNYVARYDKIGVICKDGAGKVMVLQQKNPIKNWSDEELLEVMDSCMTDEKWKNCERKFDVDKKILNYCINIAEIELQITYRGLTDADSEIFYVIVGTGKNRHLKEMRTEGMSVFSNSDLWVNLVCDEIKRICR